MIRDITGPAGDIASRLAAISRDLAVISRGSQPSRWVLNRHRAGVVNLGASVDVTTDANRAAGWLRHPHRYG